MNKKLYNILDLLRLNKLARHAGYMLVFLPCAMGVGLYGDFQHDYTKVLLFFIGAVIMRGAGCIINDIFDRDIDKHVERTKNRPIADGRIKIPEALMIFCVLSICGLFVLLQFSWDAIMVGFVGMFLLLTYPLAKRVTFWPQAYLGLAFNIGILVAVMDVKSEITWPSIVLYIGCIFWTLYYDTLYAFSDIKDDKKIGVKSLARVLEQGNYRLLLGCFGLLANVIISYAFFLTDHNVIIGFICAAAFIVWQVITLDIGDSKGCLWKFTMNSYLGIIWVAMALIHLKGAVNEVVIRSNLDKSTGIQNRRNAEGTLLASYKCPTYTKPNESVNAVKIKVAKINETIVPLNKDSSKNGINSEYFIWRTKMDAHVRQEHVLLEGKVFRKDNPPGYLPGIMHRCRCHAEEVPDYIVVDDEVTKARAFTLYLRKGITHRVLFL